MKITTSMYALTSLIVLFATFAGYTFMFADAPANPPAGNVSAPLNVGSTAQTKTGGLTVDTLTAVTEIRSNKYCDSFGLNCVLGLASTTESSPVIQNIYTTVNSLWTKVGNLVQTISDVSIGGNLDVGGTISATDPSSDVDNQVATVSFLKALSATPYGYNDFGTMEGSQNVPNVKNYSTMKEFYSDDKATVDFLCQYLGYDFGSSTSSALPTVGGWSAYANLTVITYSDLLGVTNAYSAFPKQRFLCFGGADCVAKASRFTTNLRCISKAKSDVQQKLVTEVYLPAAQLATFSKQVTTRRVGTTLFGACVYGSRSDGLNYTSSRTVQCYDSKTNAYVPSIQCIGNIIPSKMYYPTLAQCNAGVTELNKVPPFVI